MNKEREENKDQNVAEKEEMTSQATSEQNEETSSSEDTAPESEIDLLRKENEELKDKHLRLYSEFENFRRRTSKERIEMLKSAGEDVVKALLPVVDDFERALKSIQDVDDKDPVKEGVNLIYNKFLKTLEGKGLQAMESVGKEFNSEFHEAITQIPAPSEDLKGKIVDEVEKGYYLNEKVIRFAKVIIGN